MKNNTRKMSKSAIALICSGVSIAPFLISNNLGLTVSADDSSIGSNIGISEDEFKNAITNIIKDWTGTAPVEIPGAEFSDTMEVINTGWGNFTNNKYDDFYIIIEDDYPDELYRLVIFDGETLKPYASINISDKLVKNDGINNAVKILKDDNGNKFIKTEWPADPLGDDEDPPFYAVSDSGLTYIEDNEQLPSLSPSENILNNIDSLVPLEIVDRLKNDSNSNIATTHTHNYVIKNDETSHWYECEADGDKKDIEPHKFNEGVIKTEATSTTPGIKIFTCTECNYTKEESYTIDHTHTYDDSYKYDETSHWHECKDNDGGKSDIASHNFDEGVITKKPTTTETGIKTYKCSVCGYTKTETIPVIDPSNRVFNYYDVEIKYIDKTIKEKDKLEVQLLVTVPDGETAKVTYQVDSNEEEFITKVTGEGSEKKVSFNIENLSTGSHNITFRVKGKDKDDVEKVSCTITVEKTETTTDTTPYVNKLEDYFNNKTKNDKTPEETQVPSTDNDAPKPDTTTPVVKEPDEKPSTPTTTKPTVELEPDQKNDTEDKSDTTTNTVIQTGVESEKSSKTNIVSLIAGIITAIASVAVIFTRKKNK